MAVLMSIPRTNPAFPTSALGVDTTTLPQSTVDFTGGSVTSDINSAVDSSSLGTTVAVTTNSTDHGANQSRAIEVAVDALTWDPDAVGLCLEVDVGDITGWGNSTGIGVGITENTAQDHVGAFCLKDNATGNYGVSATSDMRGNVLGSFVSALTATAPALLRVFISQGDGTNSWAVLGQIVDSSGNVLETLAVEGTADMTADPTNVVLHLHDPNGEVKTFSGGIRATWLKLADA